MVQCRACNNVVICGNRWFTTVSLRTPQFPTFHKRKMLGPRCCLGKKERSTCTCADVGARAGCRGCCTASVFAVRGPVLHGHVQMIGRLVKDQHPRGDQHHSHLNPRRPSCDPRCDGRRPWRFCTGMGGGITVGGGWFRARWQVYTLTLHPLIIHWMEWNEMQKGL